MRHKDIHQVTVYKITGHLKQEGGKDPSSVYAIYLDGSNFSQLLVVILRSFQPNGECLILIVMELLIRRLVFIITCLQNPLQFYVIHDVTVTKF